MNYCSYQEVFYRAVGLSRKPSHTF